MSCRGELRHQVSALTQQLNDSRAEFHAYKTEHDGLPAALRASQARAADAAAEADSLRAIAAEVPQLKGAVAAGEKALSERLAELDATRVEVLETRDLVARLTAQSAKQRDTLKVRTCPGCSCNILFVFVSQSFDHMYCRTFDSPRGTSLWSLNGT